MYIEFKSDLHKVALKKLVINTLKNYLHMKYIILLMVVLAFFACTKHEEVPEKDLTVHIIGKYKGTYVYRTSSNEETFDSLIYEIQKINNEKIKVIPLFSNLNEVTFNATVAEGEGGFGFIIESMKLNKGTVDFVGAKILGNFHGIYKTTDLSFGFLYKLTFPDKKVHLVSFVGEKIQ